MRIRGCSKPSCEMCIHSQKNEQTEMLFCNELKKDTEKKYSCSKFRYDIFKYKPSVKNDFGKFSKEDFEI